MKCKAALGEGLLNFQILVIRALFLRTAQLEMLGLALENDGEEKKDTFNGLTMRGFNGKCT